MYNPLTTLRRLLSRLREETEDLADVLDKPGVGW